MSLKPCVSCGKECEIWPIQLGDFATLVHLRVCGGECLFMIAYEFLHKLYEHKNFRGSLYDLELAEDQVERQKLQDESMKMALDMMAKNFAENPQLLSAPVPQGIVDTFAGSVKGMPVCSGKTMRFTRPTLEQRKQWQVDYVEKMRQQLATAEADLEKMEAE